MSKNHGYLSGCKRHIWPITYKEVLSMTGNNANQDHNEVLCSTQIHPRTREVSDHSKCWEGLDRSTHTADARVERYPYFRTLSGIVP